MINLEDLRVYIEQYQQSGGDLGDVMRTCQALTGTGKTPLGLNQWVLTDKPRMEEFNEDNRIIDEQLRNKTNAGAPQEHNIVFSEFATNYAPSKYWKNAFNEVGIRLFITATQGNVIGSMDKVGVLPNGFIPSTQVVFVASTRIGSSRGTGAFHVGVDGTIYYSGDTITATDHAWGTCVFVAK